MRNGVLLREIMKDRFVKALYFNENIHVAGYNVGFYRIRDCSNSVLILLLHFMKQWSYETLYYCTSVL